MDTIKMIFTLITISTLCCLQSCSKNDEDCVSEMQFQQLQSLENCGLLLTLNLEDEWRIFEPINLDDFDIVPSDNLKVCIEFIERPDVASTCNAGELIEITSIRTLE